MQMCFCFKQIKMPLPQCPYVVMTLRQRLIFQVYVPYAFLVLLMKYVISST